jgi:hypothetical protein
VQCEGSSSSSSRMGRVCVWCVWAETVVRARVDGGQSTCRAARAAEMPLQCSARQTLQTTAHTGLTRMQAGPASQMLPALRTAARGDKGGLRRWRCVRAPEGLQGLERMEMVLFRQARGQSPHRPQSSTPLFLTHDGLCQQQLSPPHFIVSRILQLKPPPDHRPAQHTHRTPPPSPSCNPQRNAGTAATHPVGSRCVGNV